jgi:hypothetical protein
MAETTQSELANILANYVPKSEHEAVLDALNASDEEIKTLKGKLDAAEKDSGKSSKRLAELEAKVRGRAHRDAWDRISADLKVNPDFKDDVFELAKWESDSDEPDEKAMRKHFAAFLESKPRYVKADDEPAPKARLKTDDEGGGQRAATTGKFRYRSSDLANSDWMFRNGDAFSKAMINGDAVNIGD